jgi:hypothetical protein
MKRNGTYFKKPKLTTDPEEEGLSFVDFDLLKKTFMRRRTRRKWKT